LSEITSTRAGGFQYFDRRLEFGLLESVGGENSDVAAVQGLIGHGGSPVWARRLDAARNSGFNC